jgi:hypothetical protein
MDVEEPLYDQTTVDVGPSNLDMPTQDQPGREIECISPVLEHPGERMDIDMEICTPHIARTTAISGDPTESVPIDTTFYTPPTVCTTSPAVSVDARDAETFVAPLPRSGFVLETPQRLNQTVTQDSPVDRRRNSVSPTNDYFTMSLFSDHPQPDFDMVDRSDQQSGFHHPDVVMNQMDDGSVGINAQVFASATQVDTNVVDDLAGSLPEAKIFQNALETGEPIRLIVSNDIPFLPFSLPEHCTYAFLGFFVVSGFKVIHII